MNLRRVMILASGLVVLGMAVALVRTSKEVRPTVNGIPISKWLRSVGMMQVGEVAQAGTNAIPLLARSARAHDVIPYEWLARAWHALPASLRLRVRPPVAAAEVRQRALLALRDFGPDAEPALATVIEVATTDADFMVQSFARQAAAAINADHPKVLALLEHDLRSPDPRVRGSALGALLTAGTCPRALTNFIVLDMQDKNRLFYNELLALGALGPEIASFIPRILPFLTNASTCGNALAALEHAGPGGAAAVPALIDCLREPQSGLRCKAAEVLMDLGPSAKEAVPALEAAMRDEALATRVITAAARARITGDPAPSAPVILAALQAKDDGSTWSLPQGAFGLHKFGFNAAQTALWFAGELGPLARESLPVLVQRMETGPDWRRVLAARAVWKVEGWPDRTLPVLKDCLASKEEEARILACYILGEIGSPAAPVIPDMEKAERTTLATRRAALAAIQRIQQESRGKPASRPVGK
jgi:HEAT repeat protein